MLSPGLEDVNYILGWLMGHVEDPVVQGFLSQNMSSLLWKHNQVKTVIVFTFISKDVHGL